MKHRLYAVGAVLSLLCLIGMGTMLSLDDQSAEDGGADNSHLQKTISEATIAQLVKKNRALARKEVPKPPKKLAPLPVRLYQGTRDDGHVRIEARLEARGDLIRKVHFSYDQISGAVPSAEEYETQNFKARIRTVNVDLDLRSRERAAPDAAARIYHITKDQPGKSIGRLHFTFDSKKHMLSISGANLPESLRTQTEPAEEREGILQLKKAPESESFHLIGLLRLRLSSPNSPSSEQTEPSE